MMGHLRLTRWETWGKMKHFLMRGPPAPHEMGNMGENGAFSDDGPPAPHEMGNMGGKMKHFLMMGHLRLTRWETWGIYNKKFSDDGPPAPHYEER